MEEDTHSYLDFQSQGLEKAHSDASTLHHDSESDYNTADLSHISGLSKVLRADDSIADRVRCLLEDDEESLVDRRPALLDNSDVPYVDMQDKMMELFQEQQSDGIDKTKPEVNCETQSSEQAIEDNGKEQMHNETLPAQSLEETNNTSTTTIKSADSSDRAEDPCITLASNPNQGTISDTLPKDEANNLQTAGYRESIDDILNLSDSTEYSDLPKVVDNPMKNVSIREKSFKCTNEDSRGPTPGDDAAKFTGADSPVKISGQARFYVESDPNTPHCSDDSEKISHLEKYMGKHPNAQNQPGSHRDQISKVINRINQGNLINHSTPFAAPFEHKKNIRKDENQDEFLLSQPAKNGVEELDPLSPIAHDASRTNDQNITKSRGSEFHELVPTLTSELPTEDPEESLKDEEILDKVKKAVAAADQEPPKNNLRSASEISIASTVDSLAVQVRNLLTEEKTIRDKLNSSHQLDASNISNYSEEISNFEKTNLWKYAQQFMPGAPSSHAAPSTVFQGNLSMQRSNSDTSSINTSIIQKIREGMRASNGMEEASLPSHSVSRSVDMSYMSTKSPVTKTYLDFKARKSPIGGREKISTLSPHIKRPALTANFSTSFHQSPIPVSQGSAKIIGRYDKYPDPVGEPTANESYRPLLPEYSNTPQTPYSFITPRRVESSMNGAVSSGPQSTPANDLTNLPTPHDTSSKKTQYSKLSAYFNHTSTDLQKPVDNSCTSNTSTVYNSLPSKVNHSVENKRKEAWISKPSEKTHVREVTTDYHDQTSSNPLNTKASHIEVECRESPIPQRSVTPYTSSPKSVRFQKNLPTHNGRSRDSPYQRSSNSPLAPEYSFVTPRVSSRPRRSESITPKISRDRPRPPKSLPTYDQLIAEQEKSINEKLSPSKMQPAIDESRDHSIPTRKPMDDISREPTNVSHARKTAKEADLRSTFGHSESLATEFSSLKPEICYEDSYQDITLESLDVIPLSEPPNNSTMNRPLESPSVSSSDTETHRRTVSPLGGPDLFAKEELKHEDTKSKQMTDVKRAPASGLTYPLSSVQEESKTRETRDVATSPCPLPTEPAPLPFVRLSKAKAIPPRGSISTEKVQNLLMREKEVQMSKRDVGTKTDSPPAGSGESSSDDDLLNLLETFSMKAPMMEKLLKKLYERSLQKKRRLKLITQEKGLQEAMNSQKGVDQSVQTIIPTSPQNTRVLRNSSTNIPSVSQHTKRKSRKLFAENSSQTSFVSHDEHNQVENVAEIYPHEKPQRLHPRYSKRRQHTEEEQLATGQAIYLDKKHERQQHSPDPETVPERLSSRNKENLPKRKNPCAFFIDISPEKPEMVERKEPNKAPPVAWYEPYEYIPPWKVMHREQDDADRRFVDVNIQDAFLNHKRDFVIRSWERQEDIAIRAEERKLKELEAQIHQQIVALKKDKTEKRVHPLQEPRHDPVDPTALQKGGKRGRQVYWKEMKAASKMKYENLPEVVARKQDAERKKYYESNRRRAVEYKKKITNIIVQKQLAKQNVQAR